MKLCPICNSVLRRGIPNDPKSRMYCPQCGYSVLSLDEKGRLAMCMWGGVLCGISFCIPYFTESYFTLAANLAMFAVGLGMISYAYRDAKRD